MTELPQPTEVRDADVLADLVQDDISALEPGQDLGQLKLVVQIGLEPQLDLPAMRGEDAVPPLELRDIAPDRDATPPGPER